MFVSRAKVDDKVLLLKVICVKLIRDSDIFVPPQGSQQQTQFTTAMGLLRMTYYWLSIHEFFDLLTRNLMPRGVSEWLIVTTVPKPCARILTQYCLFDAEGLCLG